MSCNKTKCIETMLLQKGKDELTNPRITYYIFLHRLWLCNSINQVVDVESLVTRQIVVTPLGLGNVKEASHGTLTTPI